MMPAIQTIKPAKRRRLFAAWFGILALALPMLVPMAQGIPLSKSVDDFNAPFYVVLCKAMQNGTGGADHTPDKAPDLSDCPVCIGYAFGKSMLSAPLVCDPVPENNFLAFLFNSADETRVGRQNSRSSARAPPVTA